MLQGKQKVIFHIDMDAFFASCMQAKYPYLRNKYMVVANPGKHAIVTTASYKARSLGIHSAMPVYQAKKLCPKLEVVAAEYPLFTEISQRIWNIVYQFSKIMEVASIDEAYLDVTNEWKKYGSPKNMALAIQQEIFLKEKITSSIGISYTRFLAKTATDMNKPNGITIIKHSDLPIVLWPLEIRKMFGVGIATEKILKGLNINKIGDLINFDDDILNEKLGKIGVSLKKRALGTSSDLVKKEDNILKSISNEITLDYPSDNINELEEILSSLTQHVLNRANKRSFIIKTVEVHLRYEWLNKNNEQFDKLNHLKTIRKQITLDKHTNNFEIIYAAIVDSFYTLYKNNKKKIALIGVGLSNLINNNFYEKQLNFDDYIVQNKSFSKVEQTIYNINKKHGSKTIIYGNVFEKELNVSKSQGKYIKNYDLHISNEDIKNKWKKSNN